MTQGSLFDPDPANRTKPSRGKRALEILITVKAAPNPSDTYGETVCVAGLSADLNYPGWIRLYPINFRNLEQDVQFKKYDIITVTAVPAPNDARVESWRPDLETFRRIRNLPPWARRQKLLDSTIEGSMCELNKSARGNVTAKSLALVKPADVSDLVITHHEGWSVEEEAKINKYVNQLTLFGDERRTPLEAPRFRAHYEWRCQEQNCNGHKQGMLDWEFVRLQRRFAGQDELAVKDAIRRKFLDEICSQSNNVAFYVGNQAKRSHVFGVLGVYYPPKVRRRPDRRREL